MGKNVLQKHFNGSTWEEIHPVTTATNVICSDGQSVEQRYADYIRMPGYAVTSGTSTAYTVTLDPAPVDLVEGMGITIIPHVSNGASPMLNINGLGAVALKDQQGTALPAGYLTAGYPYSFRKVGADLFLDGATSVVVPRARMYMSAVQSFSSLTTTKMNFDSVDLNVKGLTDTANKRMVAPEAGWYDLHARINFSVSSPSDGKFILWVYVNGALTATLQESIYPGSMASVGGLTISGTASLMLNAGDTVEIYARATGSNISVANSKAYTYFDMIKVPT